MCKDFFTPLLEKLPEVMTRKDIGTYFGTYISPKYLANLDSCRKGPAKIRIGRKVIYRKEDFVAWLESRMKYEN